MVLLANSISIIKSSSNLKFPYTFIKYSSLNMDILKKIFQLGYIRGYTLLSEKDKIKVFLRYPLGGKAIRDCYMISKPSMPIYYNLNFVRRSPKIRSFIELNGFILGSSSFGLLTDIEASIIGVGYKPLFFIS